MIKNKYVSNDLTVSDEDLIAVVVDVAPSCYKVALNAEQRWRGDEFKL
jgi:hypothetical protein